MTESCHLLRSLNIHLRFQVKTCAAGMPLELCASAALSRTRIMEKDFWARLCNASLNRSLRELMLSNLSTGALAVSGAH
jgi:hypothetical protein